MPFESGNQEWRKRKRSGPPQVEEAAKLSAGLRQIVSNGSVRKWAEAMKRRFEKGDLPITQFIFERIVGKVPDVHDVDADGVLAELLERHGARGRARRQVAEEVVEPEQAGRGRGAHR